jgi:hypothetical protein
VRVRVLVARLLMARTAEERLRAVHAVVHVGIPTYALAKFSYNFLSNWLFDEALELVIVIIDFCGS